MKIKDDTAVPVTRPGDALKQIKAFFERSNVDIVVFHGKDQFAMTMLYKRYGEEFNLSYINSQ